MSRHIILSTIAMLYLFCFCNFILQWRFLDWSVLVNGADRNSIFQSTVVPPQIVELLSTFFVDSLIVASDGLLVGILVSYHTFSIDIFTDMEMLSCLGAIAPSNMCSNIPICRGVR